MDSKNLRILVATHKKYQMPKDSIYLPIHVGKEGKEDIGFQGDNTGENISLKNPNYCELTALYWAWKNLDCDYIGMSHYRRYFTKKSLIQTFWNRKSKIELILSESDVKGLMGNYEVLLPVKRNYYIETVWNHYNNAHHIKDLEETKRIINEKYPQYVDDFEEVMEQKKLFLYNMFIMKKSDFDRYCSWLFDILMELENRIDITDYDDYQKRVFGFLGERLFNVWLLNARLKERKVRVVNLEPINWPKKIMTFLFRKVE